MLSITPMSSYRIGETAGSAAHRLKINNNGETAGSAAQRLGEQSRETAGSGAYKGKINYLIRFFYI